MRTGVYTVSARKGINECISKMQRHNVDTLIVVDSTKPGIRGPSPSRTSASPAMWSRPSSR